MDMVQHKEKNRLDLEKGTPLQELSPAQAQDSSCGNNSRGGCSVRSWSFSNMYASKKTVAQGMMDIALLTANANQLRNLLEFDKRSTIFYIILVLILVSMCLQVMVGVFLIFKGRYYLRRDKKEHVIRINNYVVFGVFLITVINIIITAFSLNGLTSAAQSDVHRTFFVFISVTLLSLSFTKILLSSLNSSPQTWPDWKRTLFLKSEPLIDDSESLLLILYEDFRIFWLIVCICSGYYTYLFLLDSFYDFENNAVRFVIETDYLHWNTTFPAVSICEQESPDKLFEISQKLYGSNRDMNIDFYLRDIAFFDGTCYSCAHCANQLMNCTEDFDLIISKIKESCQNLIGNCTWDDKPFSCCDNFLPLRTESGLCYTINSIQTKKKWNSMPTLKSNRETGPGKLQVRAFESVNVYVHSPEDVPYVNHNQDEKVLLNWGSTFVMIMQVREIENDRALRLVSIKQRKCRLAEESNLNVYTHYSYSACLVSCRARVQMELCNCSSHYIPYNTRGGVVTCGVAGLACLTRHAETLRALKKVDLMKFGLNECQCMSSCSEPEYTVLSSDIELKKQNTSESYGSKITIALNRLPTERYKRTVVRTRLDLAVSIGSIIGLFLGASVLSLIEIVYYLCIRMHKFDMDAMKKLTHRLNTRKVSPSLINPELLMVTQKSDLLIPDYSIRVRKKLLSNRSRFLDEYL